MSDYDSSEAPVSVSVDDPDAYTGHMDDKPVDLEVDPEGYQGVGVSMTPAEAYHLADDLNAAADECWNGAEYLVTVVHSTGAREGPLESILTTIKAPDPEEAVRRARDLVEETAKRDHATTHKVRDKLAADATEFRTYRADTLKAVRTDSDDDNENQQ